MAGTMQWFQVTCPGCSAHLQVRLPEGITSVQCSECKAVFAVQIQPSALAPQQGPHPHSRKRKKKVERDVSAPPRALSAYNVFMKAEVAKVKGEHPDMPHREAFKMVSRRAPGRVPSLPRPARATQRCTFRCAQAAERWQSSPMNPQNGGERFPSVPGAEAGGEAGAEAGEDGDDDAPGVDVAAEPREDSAAVQSQEPRVEQEPAEPVSADPTRAAADAPPDAPPESGGGDAEPVGAPSEEAVAPVEPVAA